MKAKRGGVKLPDERYYRSTRNPLVSASLAAEKLDSHGLVEVAEKVRRNGSDIPVKRLEKLLGGAGRALGAAEIILPKESYDKAMRAGKDTAEKMSPGLKKAQRNAPKRGVGRA